MKLALWVFIALLFSIPLLYILLRWWLKRVVFRSALSYQLLLVSLPRYGQIPEFKEQRKGLREEISLFENFLSAIATLKRPVVFEIGVPHGENKIYFYIAVPYKSVGFVRRTITGLWPGSEVIPVDKDYNPFSPEGHTVVAEGRLALPYYFPLRTYAQLSEANTDPLEAFLGTKFSSEKDGMVYQLIVWPDNKGFSKRISTLRDKLQKGEISPGQLRSGTKVKWLEVLKEVIRLFTENKKKEEEENLLKNKTPSPAIEESLKLLEHKLSKPLFRVNLRVAGSSPEPFVAEEVIRTVEAGLGQFSNPIGNRIELKKVSPKKLRAKILNISFRLPDEKTSFVLNTEEIASLFHFPTSYLKSPLVHLLLMRTAPAPRNLPEEGVVLGEVFYPGDKRKVRLTRKDRRRHLYVIGQTGTGKTNFLKYLAWQDMENQDGLCFVDPHGDLAEELLGLVPDSRIDDVIYFAPGETKRVMGLNILEYDPNYPHQKTFIVNTLLEILGKLYDLKLVGGPLFEQYLRNGLLLLMDDPTAGYTLLDFPRVMVDDAFREKLLQKCKNSVVLEFWRKEAKLAQGELSMENITTWVTSKLNPFLSNDFVRPIIAQPRSTLNFYEIMNQGKILVVNLSKGMLGETSAYLLGMMLIAKLLSATFKRVEIPQDQRRDFYLFIDEFQNFAFDSLAQILSEARKYRLALHMAHQYVKQLPEELSSAVVGNVGTMVVFRIGPEDARFFEPVFAPRFTPLDLGSLPNFHAYTRLLISGLPADPFAFKTIKAPDEDFAKIAVVREKSLLRWARPREEIEKEIEKRYQEFVKQSSAPPESPTFGIGF